MGGVPGPPPSVLHFDALPKVIALDEAMSPSPNFIKMRIRQLLTALVLLSNNILHHSTVALQRFQHEHPTIARFASRGVNHIRFEQGRHVHAFWITQLHKRIHVHQGHHVGIEVQHSLVLRHLQCLKLVVLELREGLVVELGQQRNADVVSRKHSHILLGQGGEVGLGRQTGEHVTIGRGTQPPQYSDRHQSGVDESSVGWFGFVDCPEHKGERIRRARLWGIHAVFGNLHHVFVIARCRCSRREEGSFHFRR
mmetsp:Transcript_16125/g.46280  ORF Transcript_16125/g.46280 Transcript_16125/m.46280 type:complete len:253 (+) Transcript_16125:602-1360(+)